MTGNLRRSFAAVALAGLTAFTPVAPLFGQATAPAAQQAPSSGSAPASTEVTRPLRIPIGPDYSHPQPFFPHVLLPYTAMHMDTPQFTNSPRIEQLIQNGQLRITIQDAIELGLQNNTDLAVQRINSWIAEADIMRAAGGAAMRGTTVSGTPALFANNPLLSYDPALLATLSMDDKVTPVNNPLTAGTGTSTGGAAVSALTAHTTIGNFQYTQGFHTGTTIAVGLNSTRATTTSSAVRFDPALQTQGTISFTQQLLNGFGKLVNERYIRVAAIAKKATDFAFEQSVITDVTAIENDYWEFVYARGAVAVAQRSVDLAQRLVEDNQRQVDIGTLAPIEVVSAQAGLAVAQQALINAQNTLLQQQTLLMSVITKDPLAPAVRDVEILPLDSAVANIPSIEDIALNDAVTEALSKRPDVLQAKINLTADDINVKTSRNALLPNLVLSGFANSSGLSGTSKLTSGGVTTVVPGGWFDSAGQIFQGMFPEYEAQLALTLPIRNRPAQSDNARALLLQRQDEERLQQTYNGVAVDVRNTQIALRGARAALEAAQKTRVLEEQTLAAEQTKFQLGASTIFNVVSDQALLATAANAEVRAQVNLAEARVGFERAMGRTLEAHSINISDASAGKPTQNALIPGTTVTGELITPAPIR